MRKKIVGIFVCTLLISAAVLPVLGMTYNKTLKEKTSNNFSKMEDSCAGCVIPGWPHQITLNNLSPNDNESFGSSVSISGCYAIVGCPGDYNPMWFAGSAHIYERNPSTGWSSTPNQIITALNPNFEDFFGCSVSIDGDTAIIGAAGKDIGITEDVGAAYIFQRGSSGTWSQITQLQPPPPLMDYTVFGRSVSISGDYAVVGAPGHNSWQGIAYVFEKTGGVWNPTPVVSLNPSGTLAYNFGRSVSIDGDHVIVGGYDDSRNEAYVFEKTGGVWNTIPVTIGPLGGGSTYDYFGCSVSIDGDYAIVGANNCNSGKGEAYVFEKTGGVWNPTTPVTIGPPGGGIAEDYFGGAVDIDRCFAIIGAPGYCDLGVVPPSYYEGIAYVFANDAKVPDLIIQDKTIAPPAITPIGDDIYEPWFWPAVTQIGSWTSHFTLFGVIHFYSCEIVLENDGCVPLANYIINAGFLPGSPTPPICILSYTDTSTSSNWFAIPGMVNDGVSVDPCTSTSLYILIITAHAPGSGIQIGVNVITAPPLSNQDSVIFHN